MSLRWFGMHVGFVQVLSYKGCDTHFVDTHGCAKMYNRFQHMQDLSMYCTTHVHMHAMSHTRDFGSGPCGPQLCFFKNNIET